MLNSSGESGHSYFITDFKKSLQPFTIHYDASCYLSCTPNWLRVFINVGYLTFNAFLHLLRWLHAFLSFILLMWYIIFIDLYMCNYACIEGFIPLEHGIWAVSFDLLTLVQNLHQYWPGRLGGNSVVFSSLLVSSGFVIRVMLALEIKFGRISSSFIFWNSLRVGVNSFVDIW